MPAGAMACAGKNINTLVAVDLETTGIPSYEHNKTKIAELSLVAVSRENILNTPVGIPRVTHKLTLCVNPFRMINPDATNVTGLSNELLEKERTFDKEACELINLFLSRQTPPVCLVAHNGMKFDFPILQTEIMSAHEILPADILCVDSLLGFKQLLSEIPEEMLPLYIQKQRNRSRLSERSTRNITENTSGTGSISTIASDRNFMQQINETTPQHNRILNPSSPEVLNTIKAKKRLFSEDNNYAQPQLKSFKLGDIYKFLSGRNVVDSHRAENDCLTLIACMTIIGPSFLEWADAYAVPFNTIRKIR